jgi:hypothetical protein
VGIEPDRPAGAHSEVSWNRNGAGAMAVKGQLAVVSVAAGTTASHGPFRQGAPKDQEPGCSSSAGQLAKASHVEHADPATSEVHHPSLLRRAQRPVHRGARTSRERSDLLLS